jgi:hypothetical protein
MNLCGQQLRKYVSFGAEFCCFFQQPIDCAEEIDMSDDLIGTGFVHIGLLPLLLMKVTALAGAAKRRRFPGRKNVPRQ